MQHCVEWKAQRIGMGGGSGDRGGVGSLDGEHPQGKRISHFLSRTDSHDEDSDQEVLVNSTTITSMQNFKYITQ